VLGEVVFGCGVLGYVVLRGYYQQAQDREERQTEKGVDLFQVLKVNPCDPESEGV
jgi:hypothetical protein